MSRRLALIIAVVLAFLLAVASAGLYLASSILGRSTIYSLASVALWVGAVAYSRRRWPELPSRCCGGTGKKYEPLVLTLLCLRRHRAWRRCEDCGGSGSRSRPKGLALR